MLSLNTLNALSLCFTEHGPYVFSDKATLLLADYFFCPRCEKGCRSVCGPWKLESGAVKETKVYMVNSSYHMVKCNPFPNMPLFLSVCSKSLCKTLWERKNYSV